MCGVSAAMEKLSWGKPDHFNIFHKNLRKKVLCQASKKNFQVKQKKKEKKSCLSLLNAE